MTDDDVLVRKGQEDLERAGHHAPLSFCRVIVSNEPSLTRAQRKWGIVVVVRRMHQRYVKLE